MVVGILLLVALIAAWLAYGKWLEKGIMPRQFSTRVPANRVRELFRDRVARAGWKIVDDGNPMIAQSSLVTGMRQQIGLEVRSRADGTTEVVVGPQRWITKYGVPKKGHTLRIRLNSFVESIRSQDPSIVPVSRPLHGR